jgi:hypothetical protein
MRGWTVTPLTEAEIAQAAARPVLEAGHVVLDVTVEPTISAVVHQTRWGRTLDITRHTLFATATARVMLRDGDEHTDEWIGRVADAVIEGWRRTEA